MAIRILHGDVRARLADLATESVHCVVTSPPYWGLRDYGVAGQLGLEKTPTEHVAVMVDIFREVRRVLRSDGTLWLNYGDCYAASSNGRSAADTKAAGTDDRTFRDKPFNTAVGGLKPKDLCGMPWRVALALQADGWWLRQEIIWSKSNPKPDRTDDRPGTAHERVFLMTKSARYFYDRAAVRQPAKDGKTRDLRSVWHFPIESTRGEHTATFPRQLVEPCIRAGTSEGGVCSQCGAQLRRVVKRGEKAVNYEPTTIGWQPSCECIGAIVERSRRQATVLDPFAGLGTAGLVAAQLGRNAVMIELHPEYIAKMEGRLTGALGPIAMAM